jgi:nitrile hydratase accessory protein
MTDAPEPGEDAPTFDAPWQARVFALAVALTDEHDVAALTWREFQSRLVAEVDADREAGDPEVAYYRQWLAALEQALVERGVLDPGELAARVDAFEADDRDAHEFVEGDPHAHADRLPEGHADGSHHDDSHHDHEDAAAAGHDGHRH